MNLIIQIKGITERARPLWEPAHQLKNYLDQRPLNPIQKSLDLLYIQSVRPLLQTASARLAWIDRIEQGPRIYQITTFILKLPVQAVRNVLAMLYNIIKIAIYTLVHPWEAAKKALICVVALACSLTDPEVISQIGAGTLGTSLGQMAITGASPHAMLGLGIGSVVVAAGLIFGTFKTLQQAPEQPLQSLKQEWMKHLRPMPETVATGFLMGMISRTFRKRVWKKVTNEAEAREYVKREFLKKHNLSEPTYVKVNAEGTITVGYERAELTRLGWDNFAGKNLTIVPWGTLQAAGLGGSFTISIAHPESAFQSNGNIHTCLRIYAHSIKTADISSIEYPTQLVNRSGLNIASRGALLLSAPKAKAADST